MNLERVRERKGNFNGHNHNHAGKHSEIMRKEAVDYQIKIYEQGDIFFKKK